MYKIIRFLVSNCLATDNESTKCINWLLKMENLITGITVFSFPKKNPLYVLNKSRIFTNNFFFNSIWNNVRLSFRNWVLILLLKLTFLNRKSPRNLQLFDKKGEIMKYNVVAMPLDLKSVLIFDSRTSTLSKKFRLPLVPISGSSQVK